MRLLRWLSFPPVGVICAVLLLLIGFMAALLWLMTRQKGSYNTNETDGMGNDNKESNGSDLALQMKEPLAVREEEEEEEE